MARLASMASAQSKPKPPWRKLVYLVLLIIAAVILVAPAEAYGGFTVKVATVTFSETTGSLTATTPQSSVASMNVYQYMLSKAGGPVITVDRSTGGTAIAKITIQLALATPSGQSVTVSTVNIQGSVGTRDHTIFLGPGEGVKGSGYYSLTITINADITTPQGTLLESLSTSQIYAFTVN